MPNRRQWMTWVAAAILLAPAPAAAQRSDSSEAPVKAAFLYNFTKFVEWPDAAFAQPSSPFVVCAGRLRLDRLLPPAARLGEGTDVGARGRRASRG